VVAEIQAIIDRLAAADPTFQATVNPFFIRGAFEIAPSAQIVQTLRHAAGQVLGREPGLVGQTPWMDSALLAEAGIETVVMGPKGAGAHAAEEWVELDSVADMALILAQTAAEYCR
jgi:acetylornithine deacetylase